MNSKSRTTYYSARCHLLLDITCIFAAGPLVIRLSSNGVQQCLPFGVEEDLWQFHCGLPHSLACLQGASQSVKHLSYLARTHCCVLLFMATHSPFKSGLLKKAVCCTGSRVAERDGIVSL